MNKSTHTADERAPGAMNASRKQKASGPPGSPGAGPSRKHARTPKPAPSPGAPTPQLAPANGEGAGPPSPLALPPSLAEPAPAPATGGSSSAAVPVAADGAAKKVCEAPLPEGPPPRTAALLPEATGIGIDENYSKDEEALNEFLRLHPMCSAYASYSNPRLRSSGNSPSCVCARAGRRARSARCR